MAEDNHWHQYAGRFRTFGKLIHAEPVVPPSMIICIPSYAEPDLITTLESLSSCHHPGIPFEVLILFNEDDRMTDEQRNLHAASFQHCENWIREHNHLPFPLYPIWFEPMKDVKWGVGWARKILMDEAARRLTGSGVMVNLDGDCTVEKNYLEYIWNTFSMDQDLDAASIYVEHRIDQLPLIEKEAIIQYELHLRYLVYAKRWTGHPFAFQTYGSAMAVRRRAYLEQGGMNTRQAGEDFYFLQKFIELGTLKEIRETTVYPSSRKSMRVPFGTGRAMQQILGDNMEWKTIAFEIFRLIRPLFQQIPLMYGILLKQNNQNIQDTFFQQLGLSNELITFLESIEFKANCDSIASQTTSEAAFAKRFFRYFNAFMMIRYMHYMRDHFYPDTSVVTAVEELVSAQQWLHPVQHDAESYLELFRRMDKKV
ncbi:MAG TPA: hypothetical protein VFV79_03535 [Saprospiraceae bacterium]|nr:hypothetical protein [Saprospiraceae bacterium]